MAVLKEYDESKQQWQGVGAGYIANVDGSNKFTPDNIKQIDRNLKTHEADYIHLPYSIADGTNNYTTLINGIASLVEGMSVKIKFTNANTGTSTLNINGLGAKPIQKGNGGALSSGNIKAGQICHLVYTGTVFQLLGEGGEYGNITPGDVIKGVTFGTEEGIKTGTLELTGNAVASDVLSGKTFYSTNPKSKITGAMTNRGAVSKTITTQGGSYTIPKGYHSGSGSVKAQFANLVAGNIKKGVNIGGVTGTYEPTPSFRWYVESSYLQKDLSTTEEEEYKDYSLGFSGNPIYMRVEEFSVNSHSPNVNGGEKRYSTPQNSIEIASSSTALSYVKCEAMRDRIRLKAKRYSSDATKPFRAWGIYVLYVL